MASVYQIRVEGHLDGRWSHWFDDLRLAHHSDGTTTLSGPVADQAALHGLLAKVRDLNLRLVSVIRVDPASLREKNYSEDIEVVSIWSEIMIEFKHSISIKRPINEVFAFLSDFENISKWNYYVLEVSRVSEGAVGVGTAYHQVRKTDEQLFQITEFELNFKVAVKTLPPSSLQFERRFTLQAEESTTHITDEWEELDTGKPALIEKLAAGRVRSAVAENLGKLKELMETGSVRLQDGRRVSL